MSRYTITCTTEDGYVRQTFKARNKDEVIRHLSNYIIMCLGDRVDVEVKQ